MRSAERFGRSQICGHKHPGLPSSNRPRSTSGFLNPINDPGSTGSTSVSLEYSKAQSLTALWPRINKTFFPSPFLHVLKDFRAQNVLTLTEFASTSLALSRPLARSQGSVGCVFRLSHLCHLFHGSLSPCSLRASQPLATLS